MGSNVIDNTFVKLEEATKTASRIRRLCLAEVEKPDAANLRRIGSNFGDFATQLRACLNYSMKRFTESQLRHLLNTKEYNYIQKHREFPCFSAKDRFDASPLISHIENNYRSVYDYLERLQPYHPVNEWLRVLADASNTDKHEDIIAVDSPTLVAIIATNQDGTTHKPPEFVGDGLLVTDTSQPHLHKLPFYYQRYHAFASKRHDWRMFFIKHGDQLVGLQRTIEDSPNYVREIVDGFGTFI
jgi:hypothetical protein